MIRLQLDLLQKSLVPLSTSWLLGECMEARGKQELWMKQRPEVLSALREQAVIQSVESSNRIEGVTVAADRLKPVVLGKSRPRDRSEEELAGYRKGLDWIFGRGLKTFVTPRVIQHLHALAQGNSAGDAGQWKGRDNEIVEFLASGERSVRFRPTQAKDTPHAMKLLCEKWSGVAGDASIPALLAIATFVFDFLCIHPFRDGNGRVSRLLTSLLLHKAQFEVGRYVSLERIVEDSKSDYYRMLGESSKGWHEGHSDMVPWWNYFLTVLRRGYLQFATQVEATKRWQPKGDIVRHAILSQIGPFSLADIRGMAPGVSAQQIKKVLAELKEEKKVRLEGRGRGARWMLRET